LRFAWDLELLNRVLLLDGFHHGRR
jgi:hypothetical protein